MEKLMTSSQFLLPLALCERIRTPMQFAFHRYFISWFGIATIIMVRHSICIPWHSILWCLTAIWIPQFQHHEGEWRGGEGHPPPLPPPPPGIIPLWHVMNTRWKRFLVTLPENSPHCFCPCQAQYISDMSGECRILPCPHLHRQLRNNKTKIVTIFNT